MESQLPAEFIVNVDHERLQEMQAMRHELQLQRYRIQDKVIPNNKQCVACHRCATFCPESAITITENPLDYKDGYNWTLRSGKTY